MLKNKLSSRNKPKSTKKEFKIKQKNSNKFNRKSKLKSKPILIKKYF